MTAPTDRTSYNRFLLLSGPRTGSNLLTQLLNGHPELVCFREIFNFDNPIDFDVEGYDGASPVDIALRANDASRFLKTRIFGDHPEHVKAVGFKFHYGHAFGYEGILDTLAADRDLSVIHLRRRNALRTLVSLRLAEQTDQWMKHDPSVHRNAVLRRKLTFANVRYAITTPWSASARLYRFFRPAIVNTPTTAQEPLTFTAEECEQFFWSDVLSAEHYEKTILAGHRMMTIWYEDLLSDREQAFGRACDFLWVDRIAPPTVTLRQQNRESLRTLVANFDELRRSFAGSPFAPFFEE